MLVACKSTELLEIGIALVVNGVTMVYYVNVVIRDYCNGPLIYSQFQFFGDYS